MDIARVVPNITTELIDESREFYRGLFGKRTTPENDGTAKNDAVLHGRQETREIWEPSTMTDLRYPIGRFEHSGPVSDSDLSGWIRQIEILPEQLRQVVIRLSDEQLDTVYRPGGWTIRQVVHHIADSHTNCYVRFKWALTEEAPTIKTYDERRWAALVDYRLVPIQTSLDFLSVLHERWVVLLRALTPDQLSRRFVHPEAGPSELAWNVGNYAWHGRHHLAHITGTVEREGWNVSV